MVLTEGTFNVILQAAELHATLRTARPLYELLLVPHESKMTKLRDLVKMMDFNEEKDGESE